MIFFIPTTKAALDIFKNVLLFLCWLTWLFTTQILSCDQNLNKCCELIELTTSIQGQLFAILNVIAAEGKNKACMTDDWSFFVFCFFFNKFEVDCIHELFNAHSGGDFDGVETLKTRLLPWLGSCFALSRQSVTSDTSLQLIQVTKKFLLVIFQMLLGRCIKEQRFSEKGLENGLQ